MRPEVVFILLTVMIDGIGVGLIFPIMPDLIREVNGGNLAQAALWGGTMATAFAVMQFLFGPVMGGLSDRYGRRPVLLVSLSVMALDYVVMALAGTIWLLLAGRIVGGITAATQATASAYMADITPPEQRAANFGLIGAGFGMGFVLGPLIGGLLAEYGTRAPFWAAAGLAAGNVVLGCFVLRETVAVAARRRFDLRRANPLGAVRQLSQMPAVGRLLVVYFVFHVAFAVYPAVWPYFAQAQFDWNPAMIGVSLALFGLTMALVQGGLIRIATRVFGAGGTVLLGLGFAMLSFALLSIVTSGTLALLLTPIAALTGLVPPALQGIMSKRMSDETQGELQGALTSASALAMIVAPVTMTATFAAFTSEGAALHLPGAPFLLSLMLCVMSLAVFLPGWRRRHEG
jgi:MFS transporter, DHA1 family, tetracycline resistance protein